MTVSLFSESALGTASLASVVTVEDELVRGNEIAVLATLLPRIERESLALDLSAVERIDAAGIAALIQLYCSASQAGTDFSVVAPSAHVREMLRLVGLESILVADGQGRSAQTRSAQTRSAVAARCLECSAA